MSNSSVFADAKSIAVGGTAQQLLQSLNGGIWGLNSQSINAVVIKARKANTGFLYIGNATTGGGTNGSGLSAATGFELAAGDSVAIEVAGAGKIWVLGTVTGDKYDVLSLGA
ncbi:MAG TPA: hypothetical protein VH164_10985 [Ktedonobacteraceae bacterium]|nr:hypothetical protein [Ktedonobacteraceae bacterium]